MQAFLMAFAILTVATTVIVASRVMSRAGVEVPAMSFWQQIDYDEPRYEADLYWVGVPDQRFPFKLRKPDVVMRDDVEWALDSMDLGIFSDPRVEGAEIRRWDEYHAAVERRAEMLIDKEIRAERVEASTPPPCNHERHYWMTDEDWCLECNELIAEGESLSGGSRFWYKAKPRLDKPFKARQDLTDEVGPFPWEADVMSRIRETANVNWWTEVAGDNGPLTQRIIIEG